MQIFEGKKGKRRLSLTLLIFALLTVSCGTKKPKWNVREFKWNSNMLIAKAKFSEDGKHIALVTAREGKKAIFLKYMLYGRDGEKWELEKQTKDFNLGNPREFSFSFNITSDGSKVVYNGGINSNTTVYMWEKNTNGWSTKTLLQEKTDSNIWKWWSIYISGDGNTLVRGIGYFLVLKKVTNDVNVKMTLLRIYEKEGGKWRGRGFLITNYTRYDVDSHRAIADVSYDGKTVLVGSSLEEKKGVVNAYILKKIGKEWKIYKLPHHYNNTYDAYGASVSISEDGNVAVVGAPYDDEKDFPSSGAIFVYRWDGKKWRDSKIMASDGKSHDNLGEAVTISGDGKVIYVSSIENSNENGVMAGAVYRYVWDDHKWVEDCKILSPRKMFKGNFGSFISTTRDGKMLLTTDGLTVSNSKVWIYSFK